MGGRRIGRGTTFEGGQRSQWRLQLAGDVDVIMASATATPIRLKPLAEGIEILLS
jgi:hypothetical protein